MAETALTVIGRYGAWPAPGGAGRAYLVRSGNTALLCGCGSGTVAALGWSLAEWAALQAVLLPDLRPDHCADLWSLGSAAAWAAAAGERRGLLVVYAYGEPADRWKLLHRPAVLDVRRFGPEDTVPIGPLRCTFASVEHAWPGLAVHIQCADGVRLGFTGLGQPTAAMRQLLRGVDLLVAEVGGPELGDEGLDGGMAPEAAGALARELGVGRLLLSHLHPTDDAGQILEATRRAWPTAELALEGRTYAPSSAA